jgi:hypothetical protein
MAYHHLYTYNGDGYNPADILLQHYEDDKWRTIVISEDDLKPWKIAEALNNAYEAGKKDAMRNLRMMIGVEK